MDSTRKTLLDGTLTFDLSIPKLADETLTGMMKAVNGKGETGNYTSGLSFEIYTRENV